MVFHILNPLPPQKKNAELVVSHKGRIPPGPFRGEQQEPRPLLPGDHQSGYPLPEGCAKLQGFGPPMAGVVVGEHLPGGAGRGWAWAWGGVGWAQFRLWTNGKQIPSNLWHPFGKHIEVSVT